MEEYISLPMSKIEIFEYFCWLKELFQLSNECSVVPAVIRAIRFINTPFEIK